VQINKKLSLQSLTLWRFSFSLQKCKTRFLRTQREKNKFNSAELSTKLPSQTKTKVKLVAAEKYPTPLCIEVKIQ